MRTCRRSRGGVKSYCVILTAVDPRESPRKIKSFDATALLVGGELMKDSEGRSWLEDAGRCPVPAPGERPEVASARSRREPRPRLVKRVERGAPEGAADRSASEGPSAAGRPPGNRSASRRGDHPRRETGGREAGERASIAEAPPVRRRVHETTLQSLHRSLDGPEGVFGAAETRTDSARERHRARETALQLLYQWEVGGIDANAIGDAVDLFWAVHPAPPPRRELALGLARGAVGALPQIDALIARHSDNWRSERLAVVDRLIMRLAVYELLFERTPPAVVINEALELAKTFSGGARGRLHQRRARCRAVLGHGRARPEQRARYMMGVEAARQRDPSVGEQTSDAEAWAGVRSALEQRKKDLWRTVKGLAKESGLKQEQVESLLVQHRSDVVRREGEEGWAKSLRVEGAPRRVAARACEPGCGCGGRGAETDQGRGGADQGTQGAQEGADESGLSARPKIQQRHSEGN